MTRGEFAKGWKLLILQPWGSLYRGLTDQGQPTEEAQTQMEFYYDKLKWAHPEAWWRVAALYAQGKEEKTDKKGHKVNPWPSVWELRTALQHINHEYVRMLPTPQPIYTPCPPEVAEVLRKFVQDWGVRNDSKTGTA